jgi:hypothetical protein
MARQSRPTTQKTGKSNNKTQGLVHFRNPRKNNTSQRVIQGGGDDSDSEDSDSTSVGERQEKVVTENATGSDSEHVDDDGDDDDDEMNGGTNTGNASTTGTSVTGGSGGTTGTSVTGGSGGTAGGVVAVAHNKKGGVLARQSDGESARMALAREEIRSGQKISDDDYRYCTVPFLVA